MPITWPKLPHKYGTDFRPADRRRTASAWRIVRGVVVDNRPEFPIV